MVNPLYLFAASLGAAFLLPLIDRIGRRASISVVFAVTAAWGIAAAVDLAALLGEAQATDFGTAGFMAPLAIVLRVGLTESLGMLAIALVGLAALLSMRSRLEAAPIGGSMALLMALMGLSGIVLTRDLFNLFVFLEISSIATYGLIGFDDRRPALRSGFKYMMAGGIASSLYLIGVIYIYRFSGQLNLDLAAATGKLGGAAGGVAVFFLLAALLVELKPFPANGWAIDVYETADPGVSAILSGASATALTLALWKIVPILGPAHLSIIAGSGLATFAAANLAGARQTRTRRMLGYSSVAQIGLVLAAIALGESLGFRPSSIAAIVFGLLANHLLAKSGLFLLTRTTGEENEPAEARQPLAAPTLAVAGMLVAALVGLPPFPGFWAKWELIGALANAGSWWTIGIILAASLAEAFYILRWFGSLAKGRKTSESGRLGMGAELLGPAAVAAVALAIGLFTGSVWFGVKALLWAPLAVGAVLFLMDAAPGWLKAAVSVGSIAAFAYLTYPMLDGFRQIFALLLLGGGAMYSIASLYKGGARRGLHPLLTMTTLALGGILVSSSNIELFLSWELMTAASWLLVLRGRNGERAALRYIVFGLAGAFLLMVGLLAGGFEPTTVVPWAGYLMVAGLLVKAGAIGLHIWLPGAYAESDDEVSGFLSASLSKASVFLLGVTLFALTATLSADAWSFRIIGWIGLATALFGALYAIYQEDIKKTLAWSSMGQIGYIVLAFAMMDQAGWTTGLYLAVNHFLYKSMLFLAIAGVIQQVGTRDMFKMGGLIKRMPVSFLSTLMAIIALSGVPPLSGFGGKWLLYSALIDKGWYFEAAIAFFSSAVAFLYLFRLIHTIFLGQPKLDQKNVREAPAALVVPQVLLMVTLFAVSAFPRLMLDPIMAMTGQVFQPTLSFEGSKLVSAIGYWNGTLTMYVTIVVFVLCLAWLIANLHNPQAVKQFNIVFAAERPLKPETTHFAWNFYAPYERALGFLTRKRSERFWTAVSTGVDAVGGTLRRLYTGNGQTYALHVVLYVVALYLISGVY